MLEKIWVTMMWVLMGSVFLCPFLVGLEVYEVTAPIVTTVYSMSMFCGTVVMWIFIILDGVVAFRRKDARH